jgi:subtilisin family serine protease
VPAGRLDELAADADVPQLSGDHVIHGQMAVTDVSIGADQAWASDFGPGGNGVTGKGVGVAILDSGVTIVPD